MGNVVATTCPQLAGLFCRRAGISWARAGSGQLPYVNNGNPLFGARRIRNEEVIARVSAIGSVGGSASLKGPYL